MNYGFVIRNDRCIGCHACTTACKSENDVPVGVNRTWVKNVEKGRFPDVRRTFQVTRCNHCANPPCVTICPVSAMYQRHDGIVEFDPDRCIGCKACLQACPYDAIYIDPESGTAAKCHFCAHRVELNLEPACVVVCPEHAIISGDIDDPSSEISRELARWDVTVRKPEQGTLPKLFYVDGDEVALTPTMTEPAPGGFAWAETFPSHESNGSGGGRSGPITIGSGRMASEMVRDVYNAQHRIPWHWPVPAYLVTKAVGTGLFLIVALGHLLGLFGYDAAGYLTAGFLSLLFTGATTALLVLDLERPERFLRILTRPQWRSWLTRGGYLLVAFTLVAGVWLGLEAGAAIGWWEGDAPQDLRSWAFVVGAPLAAAVAAYTAFLFGQAEGRDLWQSPLLPAHLLVQAFLAGSAALLVAIPFLDADPAFARVTGITFVVGLLVDALLILTGEMGMSHASENAARAVRLIRSGPYRNVFWWGAVGIGHAAPLALVLVGNTATAALAGAFALGGLYAWEHAFVMAPQDVPNS